MLQLDKDSMNELISNHEKMVLVLFSRNTCPHCQKLLNELDGLSQMEQEHIAFGQIDIEKEVEISSQYDIEVVPSLFFFKDNQIKEKLVGYYSALVIEANIIRLKQILKLK